MEKLNRGIWKALDIVRGSIDIEDSRNAFISLAFIKYVSDNIYRFEGIPESLNWSNLLSNAYKAPAHQLLRAYNDIDRFFPNLQGVFNVLSGKLPDDKTLTHLINAFSELKLDGEEWIDVLESYMQFYTYGSGRNAGEFTTPWSVSRLMGKLKGNARTVYDPACGTGSFLYAEDPMVRSFGQEYSKEVAAIGKLRFAFDENVKIESGDSFFRDSFSDLKVDAVVVNPPFNQMLLSHEMLYNDERFPYGNPTKSNANFMWIQHALHHLNDNGMAILLMPIGSLFRGGAELPIRKKLLEENLVDAIIKLPSNLFHSTSVPTCIWILKKNRLNKSVLMVNGTDLGIKESHSIISLSSEHIAKISNSYLEWTDSTNESYYQEFFLRAVSLEEIRYNDFNLNVEKFINTTVSELDKYDFENRISLEQVLKPYKAEKNQNCQHKTLIRNLSNNPDLPYLELNELEPTTGKDDNLKILKQGVLLCAKIGDLLKPTLVPNLNSQTGITNNILSFNINEDEVLPEYLINELHKPYISEQLGMVRVGVAQKALKQSDLLKVLIDIPLDKKRQQEILDSDKKVRFDMSIVQNGYEKQIKSLLDQQHEDLRMRRHNLMQHMNNVIPSLNVLHAMMKNNKGLLNGSDLVSKVESTTVNDCFIGLSQSFKDIFYQVDNLTNEMSFEKKEPLSLHSLIESCINQYNVNANFDIIFEPDTESFKQDPGWSSMIEISRGDFSELFNNIAGNAARHSFVDPSEKYELKITSSFEVETRMITLIFSNNGKPFPKGIAERYGIKFEKAGKTANEGLGAWRTSEISKHFDMNMEVIDEPNEVFPVAIKFKMKLYTIIL